MAIKPPNGYEFDKKVVINGYEYSKFIPKRGYNSPLYLFEEDGKTYAAFPYGVKPANSKGTEAVK